jgi:hypothetical protein
MRQVLLAVQFTSLGTRPSEWRGPDCRMRAGMCTAVDVQLPRYGKVRPVTASAFLLGLVPHVLGLLLAIHIYICKTNSMHVPLGPPTGTSRYRSTVAMYQCQLLHVCTS